MILESVISDARDRSAALWDIEVQDECVQSIHPSPSEASSRTPPQLLLPPLCHPHIHLDKAYILTCNNPSSPQYPDYSDLCSGSFHEALANTSRAKERYTPDDLYLRGSQLLATSYTQGVTSMRAFVEFVHSPKTPSTQPPHGDENRAIIEDALAQFAGSIGALGTTPYVETSRPASLSNIEWAITRALKHDLHLDFHLDYTLESPLPSQKPLTYSVLDLLGRHKWAQFANNSKTIVLGHCTQLTMLDDAGHKALAETITGSKLPIHFVGLPTSDIFMMGRPTYDSKSRHNRPRGTIHVPSMITEFGLSACLGVNNVGNAFTPYGTGDPLQLASWAVGIYQVGTAKEAELLYECVSNRARQAIGLDGSAPCAIHEGDRLSGMLLLKNQRVMELPGALGQSSMTVAPRRRLSLQDVVWDPPENRLRFIV
ncbi:hypothetical protein CIB48_g2949 [Xylaria polymorpha]|nr:hypothetical protein CIB48_g2949 [Xylaria polymorpha]